MLETLLLSLALAADAFAASIGLGAANKRQSRSYFLKIAILIALYFGIAQGIMPLIGYSLGASMLGWLADSAPWIAFVILVVLGAKMLYESRSVDDQDVQSNITHRTLLTLAIATSIDAMAAGFTLNLLSVNAYLACLIIAITTGSLSLLGAYIGRHSGTWLGSWAEALGGLVLIGIGVNMVI